LFANHTFVGIVDGWRRLAAIQHNVKLYLVDYGAVLYPPSRSDLRSYEFFYQIGLSEFANFGTIEFAEGINLRDLLVLSLDAEEQDGMLEQAQAEEIDVCCPSTRLTLVHS
jgi:DNA mismatch repair protein MLH1